MRFPSRCSRPWSLPSRCTHNLRSICSIFNCQFFITFFPSLCAHNLRSICQFSIFQLLIFLFDLFRHTAHIIWGLFFNFQIFKVGYTNMPQQCVFLFAHIRRQHPNSCVPTLMHLPISPPVNVSIVNLSICQFFNCQSTYQPKAGGNTQTAVAQH